MKPITANSSCDDVRAWIETTLGASWDRALPQLVGGETMYLWYRPSAGPVPGSLMVCCGSPGEQWEPVTSERVSPYWTRDRYKAIMLPIVNRLPLLPTEEASCTS